MSNEAINEKWHGFEAMWTDKLNEHFLLKQKMNSEEKLLIYRVTPTSSGIVVIEDDETLQAVVLKMQTEGVPVIDSEQARKLRESVRVK